MQISRLLMGSRYPDTRLELFQECGIRSDIEQARQYSITFPSRVVLGINTRRKQVDVMMMQGVGIDFQHVF